MNVQKWLTKVAWVGKSDLPSLVDDASEVYYSKFDNSYITLVGMEDQVKHLAKLGITECLSCGTGYSPKKGKWYGWSHRAIYGFAPGSTCKLGDCHYRASNVADEIEYAEQFFHDKKYNKWTKGFQVAENKIAVVSKYNNKVPNKKLRGTIDCVVDYFDPNNFGKGEWTAKNMADARQMAIDFSAGVS